MEAGRTNDIDCCGVTITNEFDEVVQSNTGCVEGYVASTQVSKADGGCWDPLDKAMGDWYPPGSIYE